MANRIEYNNRVFRYDTPEDLARKANILVSTAEDWINGNPNRILIRPEGVRRFNIRDNFSGLLRDFGIRTNIRRERIIGNRRNPTDVRVGDNTIAAFIPGGELVTVRVDVKFYLISTSDYSEDWWDMIQPLVEDGGVVKKDNIPYIRTDETITRQHSYTITAAPQDLQNMLLNLNGRQRLRPNQEGNTGVVADWMRSANGGIILAGYSFIVRDFNGQRLRFDGQTLRESVPLQITEWINIEYNDTKGPDSCVVNFVSKRFPHLATKIKSIESNGGVKVMRFMQFMTAHKILYGLFTEKGVQIATNQDELDDCHGVIYAIIYNNHIYPLRGGRPRRPRQKDIEDVIVDDSMSELKELLDQGKLPKNVRITAPNAYNKIQEDAIIVNSFESDNQRVVGNEEYTTCQYYMEQINAAHMVTTETRLVDLPLLIEKAKNMNDTRSFIPEITQLKTPPLLWKTSDDIDESKVTTIDKNKCYPYVLATLPYLLVFDYRKHAITKNPTVLVPHHLYIARPHKWSILLPKTKLYAGYFLMECQSYGFTFDLLEELHSETVNNHFGTIVNYLLDEMKMDMATFKTVMNVTIGKMEREYAEKDYVRYKGIYTHEAAEAQEGYSCDLGDYKIYFESITAYTNVRNRLPIATQVKDGSRMLIYKKIRELGIRDEQLVQINTDSISYYGRPPPGLNANDFAGWKISPFGGLGIIGEEYNEDVSILNLAPINKQPRILHMKYAGAGKTTHIINKLVPRLIKKNISHIVLTPTHKTLSEYRQANINCEVIQKYIHSGTIPDVDYVIVDEVGFITLECHDVLFKIVQAGKALECFGDFNQLPPVGEMHIYNQPHYLKYLFNDIRTDYTNYRNNFTTEYYDRLISSTDSEYLIKQVKKYSQPLELATRVICYCHKTRELYNKRVMRMMGLPRWPGYYMEDTLPDALAEWDPTDLLVVCTKDGLRHKSIYNRMEFNVTSINGKKITLSGNGVEATITIGQLLKHFEPAYAINVHQAQGLTIDSYHWAKEDDDYITNRIAYVIISRIRQN